MRWATEKGMSFGPEKYGIMHLEPTGMRRKGTSIAERLKKPEVSTDHGCCALVPEIPGLDASNVLKTEMRVLGVHFNYKLEWHRHVYKIAEKVRSALASLWRISSSSYGAELVDLRNLYLTKIRPLFSYACAAWYVPGKGLRNKEIEELEGLQRQCLNAVAGCWKNTNYQIVLKELNIERLSMFLHRSAAAYRARTLGSDHEKLLRELREKPIRGLAAQRHDFGRHIFHVLYREAFDLRTAANLAQEQEDAKAAAAQPPSSTEAQRTPSKKSPVQRNRLYITKRAKAAAKEAMEQEWNRCR
ncbi:hypothetical protein QBC34DRAFT_440851 [Podospora aff. communis PSN243]|uniref:Uncharacterized protein n=1 Tax=Podospora aff. communis PSN243 TaxID=3040156 RepID=A0AAV9GFG1_9PEZI|nr:hypothetical protein QBC34DRAFT_440851 [Podospora aff. communis PSN243]